MPLGSWNTQLVATFVKDHPGCRVSDVVDRFGCDAGTAWGYLLEAERLGLITADNSDGGTWHFRSAAPEGVG